MEGQKKTSTISSQDGKIQVALITALIVGLIAALLCKYTGTKLFINRLSSGVARLTVGLLSFLYLYLWYGTDLFRGASFGEFGEQVFVYSVLSCLVMAFVLIPLGLIQTIVVLIRQGKERRVE